MLAAGWSVVSASRTPLDYMEELALKPGQSLKHLATDLSNEAGASELARFVRSEHREIHGLVNNAGEILTKMIGITTSEELERIFRTNTFSAYFLSQKLVRMMRGAGSIVNVSSTVAMKGRVGQTAYSASKAAMNGLTIACAQELAPVRVNSICPGFVETELMDTLNEDERSELLKQIPLRRFASPQDIAEVVRFLLSDESCYVSGAVIPVDGGYTA